MNKPEHLILNETEEELMVNQGAVEEASSLLKNGILVETEEGLVCMSLNDALSSNLNLSAEELHNITAQLLLQHETPTELIGRKQDIRLENVGFESHQLGANYERSLTLTDSIPKFCESDGFSSEASETTYIKKDFLQSCTDKSGEESSASSSLQTVPVLTKKKGRGGWPKGRKRKPELLNLPPKAPATSYNLYLNEQRIFFKESKLPFYEITKIIGNRWSSLTLAEKKPYLDRAEEDKKRYREELKQYRQSAAYRSYLYKKRKKKLQNHVLSESDMDATDDFDEEDNEELYCRTCDQWFHNFHNKREHLQAKKHRTSVAGDLHRKLTSDSEVLTSTSLDESSLDGAPDLETTYGTTSLGTPLESTTPRTNTLTNCLDNNILSAMRNLVQLVKERETELTVQRNRRQEVVDQQMALCQQLVQLNDRKTELKKHLAKLKEQENEMDSRLSGLWQVPSWYVMNHTQQSDST